MIISLHGCQIRKKRVFTEETFWYKGNNRTSSFLTINIWERSEFSLKSYSPLHSSIYTGTTGRYQNIDIAVDPTMYQYQCDYVYSIKSLARTKWFYQMCVEISQIKKGFFSIHYWRDSFCTFFSSTFFGCFYVCYIFYLIIYQVLFF